MVLSHLIWGGVALGGWRQPAAGRPAGGRTLPGRGNRALLRGGLMPQDGQILPGETLLAEQALLPGGLMLQGQTLRVQTLRGGLMVPGSETPPTSRCANRRSTPWRDAAYHAGRREARSRFRRPGGACSGIAYSPEASSGCRC